MNIFEKEEFEESLKDSGFHVLTFAETGFSMLNIYGEQYGFNRDVIEKFSKEVNARNESGSLYPKAPISVIPRHFIREDNSSDALVHQIEVFLKANHQHIKAKKLLFDFRAGVAPFVLSAIKNALKCDYVNDVEEVIIINSN